MRHLHRKRRPQPQTPAWWRAFEVPRRSSWDYRNRLIQTAASSSPSATYLYDHTDQRVRKSVGSATTTTYVNKYFDVTTVPGTTTATTTAYIWAGDVLVAFVEGNGAATSTRFVHPDHLGSTNVLTDESGAVSLALDYMPFGEERVNSGSGAAERTFIGQFFDRDSVLSYLNARYYEGSRGQFTSQDPVHLAVGNAAQVKQLTGQELRAYLADPQQLNSYAYARGNPIRYKDPRGTCPVCPFLIAGGVGALGGIGVQAFNDVLSRDFANRSWQQNLGAYSVAAGEGAAVGLGTAVAIATAPLVGLSGMAGAFAVGLSAGGLNAGTSLLGNSILGQPTDSYSLVLNSTITGLTAGTLRTLPQIRGRLPSFGTKAFYTGAHTARQAAEEFVIGSGQAFGQQVSSFVSTPASPGGSSAGGGGGSANSIIQGLRSIVATLQSLISSLTTSSSRK